MSVESWLPDYQNVWDEVEHDPIRFFQVLRGRDIIDDATYIWEYKSAKGLLPAEEERGYYMPGWTAEGLKLRPVTPEELASPKAGLSETISVYFAQAFNEVLNSFWLWLRENVSDLFHITWGYLKDKVLPILSDLKREVVTWGEGLYRTLSDTLLGEGVITPERAPELGARLFAGAMGFGISAHLISMGVELIHPFKELGLSQGIGMLAQLASFGPVSAATMGVITATALRRPMQYAINARTRSQLPDEGLLQTLAVKLDIPIELFTETMKYHGYSDFWIDRIRASMYREPMYRELLLMAESDVATDAWMIDKLRRSGYDAGDAPVMHRALLKRVALTQRNSYYSQAFALFKEGYIPREYFNRVLDELDLRPEAQAFAVKSAELAYLYDTINDEIKYWTDSYLKDQATEEQLELRMSLLGVNRWRVDLLVRLARVRKYKKPAAAERPELEKVMTQARSKYSQAYITLFRNDQIDVDTLYNYLVEIGIAEELVEATVFLEEARKLK